MINICFCSDENLITFIPVVITSILRKNSNNMINIHYIHNIDDNIKINNLANYINQHQNLKLFIYNKKWERNYTGLSHISNATMLRLFIPDILKCDKVIYMDIDIIVNINLYEIYNIDCGETGIAIKNSIHKKWEKYFDDNSGKKSGNCGIIVMDLNTLRQNNFTQKCLEIHSKNQNRHDQYIINMYAYGNHTVLEPRFNIFLNQDDYLVEEETEFILHYAGSNKPYYHNACKYQYLWNNNKPILSHIFNNKTSEKYNIKNIRLSDTISINYNKIYIIHPKKYINLGVLVYNNSYNKYASSNIGDYIQSLSSINIYRKIIQDFNNTTYDFKQFVDLLIKNEIPNFNIIFIKRDNIHDIDQYKGLTNIITIMNGWWIHPYNEEGDISFIIPLNITPIFISFHLANKKLLSMEYLNELKKYQPIGCRDLKTTEILKNKGVKTYFSGCLTTTIDFFKWNNKTDIIYNTDTKVKDGINFSHSRGKWKNIDHTYGLIDAMEILENYSKCKYVNTSRLHCYLPCLAMGVPVNFISPNGDPTIKTWGSRDRFDGLRELQDNPDKFIKMKNTLETDTYFKVKKQILHNIFNIGKTILSNNIIGYDENRYNITQPYYNILSGIIKCLNITNVIEIGTHKGGSGLAMIYDNPNLQLITIDVEDHNMASKRLKKYDNCKRLIGDSLSNEIKQQVKRYFTNNDGNTLLYIDALKNGEWVEKNIDFYNFINPKYILLDDITIDNNMNNWWNKFSLNHNCFNWVDYLGKECRNISNLNCGFGLIFIK